MEVCDREKLDGSTTKIAVFSSPAIIQMIVNYESSAFSYYKPSLLKYPYDPQNLPLDQWSDPFLKAFLLL